MMQSNVVPVMATDGPSKDHGTPFQPLSWAVMGDLYKPCPLTTDRLPSGFYRAMHSPGGSMMARTAVSVDGILPLPDPVADMLLMEFVTFWQSTEKFRKLGLSAKRGVLMHGPQGCGKTSAIQRMAAHAIKELDGIVFIVDWPSGDAQLLQDFRRIEPERPLILLFEDVDAIIDRNGESALLAMLDGELQVRNVVSIATTNYVGRLGSRLIDRPGRFDRVVRVGMPSREAREFYLRNRLPDISPVILARVLDTSEDWSIAHLRELVVATEVLGEDVGDVIRRLKEMGQLPEGEEDAYRPIAGIGRDLVEKGRSFR